MYEINYYRTMSQKVSDTYGFMLWAVILIFELAYVFFHEELCRHHCDFKGR